MSEETKIYKLCEGDWSGDGHEKSTDYYVKCNMNPAEFYEKAVKIAKYDLIKDYCHNYEDNDEDWEDYFEERYESYVVNTNINKEKTNENTTIVKNYSWKR